jgi:hypothetical protein
MNPESWGTLLAVLAAAAVYLNTLPAGFCFDDNFAVVSHVLLLQCVPPRTRSS